jgi:hypothetical protein
VRRPNLDRRYRGCRAHRGRGREDIPPSSEGCSRQQQIIRARREADGGKKVADIWHDLAVSQQAFCRLKRRLCGAGLERVAGITATAVVPIPTAQ